MCYSAQIWAEHRKYVRAFGVEIDIKEYVKLFWQRNENDRIKIPKAMEESFTAPQGEDEAGIKRLTDAYKVQQADKLAQELFKQRKRLVDAQRSLVTKTTKAATEAKRIASTKIELLLAKLADSRRTELKDSDSRIYPGYFAPVLIVENGKRLIRPMRYQCRPAGKPAAYDTRYLPGGCTCRSDGRQDALRPV